MTSFHSVEDARNRAAARLPKMIFDYIDGAAGKELLAAENTTAMHNIKLQPRALVNIEERVLSKTFLNNVWDLPFGIAPMGLCDLAWPGTDRFLSNAAIQFNIPHALSTMGSSTIEKTKQRAGDNAWFQLYVGGSKDDAMHLVQRALTAGYETLILTVDVPLVAPRIRDLKNGFKAPLKIGLKQFIDFALHPNWSISTLRHGKPSLVNVETDTSQKFSRLSGRGNVEWDFLQSLRDAWPHQLIVKGIVSIDDAIKVKQFGADAIYVSNHGGRQLDSAPASIDVLPLIRTAVGSDYPLIVDSGFRDGESIVKALALGADFVMLGRPFSFASAANGQAGVNTMVTLLADQISATMAQIGITEVESINSQVLFKASMPNTNA